MGKKRKAREGTAGKSIDDVFKQIQKKFGAESVHIFGDKVKTDEKIEVISTGSILVDQALGLGGFPRGRIIEILGPESSGKCLSGNTYIASEYGLLTVRELFELNNVVPSCTSKITPATVRLLNKDLEFEPTLKFVNNNRRPTIKITTVTGNVIKSSHNHPHLVMSKIGNWVWKQTSDITTDDYLVTTRKPVGIPKGETYDLDLCYFLGICIADAHFAEHRILITNNDPAVFSSLRNHAPQYFGKAANEYPENRNESINFHFTSKDLTQEFYQKFGFSEGLAKDKCFPVNIRRLSLPCLRKVIQGYMDCECSIDADRPNIEVTSASYKLIFALKQLLQMHFGIVASLASKRAKNYPDNKYYRLTIYGRNVYRYARKIGTASPLRKRDLRIAAKNGRKEINPNNNAIPYCKELLYDLVKSSGGVDRKVWKELSILGKPDCRLTYRQLRIILNMLPPNGKNAARERLQEICDANYFYDQVVSIKQAKSMPLFDFEMMRTHSFVANSVITHNTTVALHVIAEAQKRGGMAAFIDAEHALDLNLAKKMGVDLKKLMINQPDTGEQGLEIVEMAAESGKFAVIVIDSVSALTPRAEIEGDMGDSHMGLQARMMGQALRKIVGVNAKTNTMTIFINQIRHKIGVSWGCFHAETPVAFADGSQHEIKEVVDKKLVGPVLSYNSKKGIFEARNIIDWHFNGDIRDIEKWRSITTESSGGRGCYMSFTCTDNHRIFVKRGKEIVEIPAQHVKVGDKLVSWYTKKIQYNDYYMKIMFGSILGDGTFRRRSLATASFSLANQLQPEYLQWKKEKLKYLNFSNAGNAAKPRLDSEYTAENAILMRAFYAQRKGKNEYKLYRGIQQKRVVIPALSAAVWYMDDGNLKTDHNSGSICIKRLLPNRMEEAEKLRLALVSFTKTEDSNITIKGSSIVFNTVAFNTFNKKICKLIPPCMQYKLLPKYRGKYIDFDTGTLRKEKKVPLFVGVIDITRGAKRKHRCKHKYDLTIEGFENYLVGGMRRGLLVHNSNETTSGGNALKFFASIRLDIRRTGSIVTKVDGEERVIGNKVKVKIIKNKLAMPFKVIETELLFGKGFNMAGELIQLGEASGVVEQEGKTFLYKHKPFAKGKNSAYKILAEDKKLFEAIRADIVVARSAKHAKDTEEV